MSEFVEERQRGGAGLVGIAADDGVGEGHVLVDVIVSVQGHVMVHGLLDYRQQ